MKLSHRLPLALAGTTVLVLSGLGTTAAAAATSFEECVEEISEELSDEEFEAALIACDEEFPEIPVDEEPVPEEPEQPAPPVAEQPAPPAAEPTDGSGDDREFLCSEPGRGGLTVEDCFGPGSDKNGNGVADVNEQPPATRPAPKPAAPRASAGNSQFEAIPDTSRGIDTGSL
ncbi:hypothetical protein [Blastococcus sp. SYSU D01042]